jgi:hypothetical protein
MMYFLLFLFLYDYSWTEAGVKRAAPLKRLRHHTAPLDLYKSTNCSVSRGFASVRAPPPRADGSPRVLIWMLDDRPVSPTFPESTKDYVSINVMHNYLYAQRHGYDFVLLNPTRKAERYDLNGALVDVNDPVALSFNPEVKGIATKGCYNRALLTWRASTWCKVLAQWAFSTENPADETLNRWDLMVFIDSDAVAAFPHVPINESFSETGTHVMGGNTVYGLNKQREPLASLTERFDSAHSGANTFYLYSDRQKDLFGQEQWRLANLGFFVVRDTAQLRPLLKTWWTATPGEDYERFDFEAYHEQEIFWRMQTWPEYANAMSRCVRVSDVPWAPLQTDQYNRIGGFLQHVNSEEDSASFGAARLHYFDFVRRHLADAPNFVDKDTWPAAVQRMRDGCHMIPIDFDAIDEHVASFKDRLEKMSWKDLWAPLDPPASQFATPSPVPHEERVRRDRIW